MALQLWMPLRGNLDNLGLADVGFVADSTATVSNNGKIGKCYQFQGYSGYGIHLTSGMTAALFMDSYINNHSFSIACWVKTSSASTCICTLTYGVRLFVGNTTQFNIFSRESLSYAYGAKSNDNKWHHIAGVYDAEANNLIIYVDGVAGSQVAWPGSGTYSSDWTNGLFIGRDCNNNTLNDGYFFQGLMNDFRVYDHALSQAEVHSLSQGLVVHYKMDDEYIEGTTNLSNAISGTCYNSANGKYGYNETSNMQKESGFFQGRECDKVSMIEAGLNARPYIYISNMFVSNGGSYPEYKTLSFYYYPTRGTYINPYKLGSGTSIATYTVTNTETKTGLFTNSGNIPIVSNMWNHIEVTFHGTTETSAEWGFIINGDTHTSTNTDYWLFANVLVEAKDHATPFTSSSRTALTYIQDHSGYQNNGQANNLSIDSSHVGRYNSSLYFNGNESSITIDNFTPNSIFNESFTIAFWQYRTDTDRSIIFGNYNQTPYFNLEYTSSSVLRLYMGGDHDVTLSAIPNNELVHVAVVLDRSVNKVLVYKNGLLQSTTSHTYPIVDRPACTFRIGKDVRSDITQYKGYLSDFRIYSTALSSDDILSLYQLGARIDNKKNLHSFEIEEISSREILPISEYTLSGYSSYYSEYLPIDPGIYHYDITYSAIGGDNWHLIGFEKFDINKTPTSNSGCVYVTTPTGTEDRHRIFGTINLTADTNGNTIAFTRLRLLNDWNNKSSSNTMTIYSMSLRKVDVITPLRIKRNGVSMCNEFIELDDASIRLNGITESNNIYEI